MDETTNFNDSASKPRVLLVDGLPHVRHMISSALRLSGYQVISAYSDHTVFTIIHAFQPDLVILDMQIDGMSEQEVKRNIHNLRGFFKIPVIVISSDNDLASREACMDAGAQDFLAMPFEPSLLVNRIEALVGV